MEIIWSVHIYEIREQSLGRGLAGLLEKIVVRIPRVVIHPGFKLEYRDRENSCFPITKPAHNGIHNLPHGKPALRRGIHTVVNGAEWNLGTGTGMEGIEIMNQCLHGLMGLLGGIITGQAINIGSIQL